MEKSEKHFLNKISIWLKQQTMLVNENRLSLADAAARKYLSEQTEKYFFGEGADTASGYVPPAN